MKHELRLHGNLAKQCGDTIALNVASPREMFRALGANFPSVRQEILPHNWVVFVDGKNIGEDQLDIQLPERSVAIELYPHIHGSGGGGIMPFVQIALGVVMVIAGVLLIETPSGAPLIMGGVGFVAAGLVGVFFPTPKVDMQKMERPDQRNSYVFSGINNTSSQGAVIPLVYGGPIRVGSLVINSGIQNEQSST